MATPIKDLYFRNANLKKDFRVDFKEDAREDWRKDWAVLAGANTLVDGSETVAGVLNTMISGNLLANVTPEAGEIYRVTGFTVNTMPAATYAPGVSAPVVGVGVFTVAANGTWTFTPETDYVGAIPTVSYNVTDGDLTVTSTLTISDIV